MKTPHLVLVGHINRYLLIYFVNFFIWNWGESSKLVFSWAAFSFSAYTQRLLWCLAASGKVCHCYLQHRWQIHHIWSSLWQEHIHSGSIWSQFCQNYQIQSESERLWFQFKSSCDQDCLLFIQCSGKISEKEGTFHLLLRQNYQFHFGHNGICNGTIFLEISLSRIQ